MSDFEYDCLEKKRLARQAKYRKNGSKSKKCTLPSDRLTNKEWKERCGELVSYNLGAPMSWDEFKKLPERVQAEYLEKLRAKYQVTSVELGRMFGVKPLTVRRHVENNKLGVSFPRGHTMSAQDRCGWDGFLGNSDGSEHVSDSETLHNDEAGPECTVVATGESAECDNTAVPVVFAKSTSYNPEKTMSMRQVCLRFDGTIDVDAIANSLKFILGSQANGEVEIVCSLN